MGTEKTKRVEKNIFSQFFNNQFFAFLFRKDSWEEKKGEAIFSFFPKFVFFFAKKIAVSWTTKGKWKPVKDICWGKVFICILVLL